LNKKNPESFQEKSGLQALLSAVGHHPADYGNHHLVNDLGLDGTAVDAAVTVEALVEVGENSGQAAGVDRSPYEEKVTGGKHQRNFPPPGVVTS